MKKQGMYRISQNIKLLPFIEINAQVCGKLKENSISFKIN